MPAGFGQALVLLLGVRCALGIAESVIYPSANQLVARWFPQKERGIVNGLIFAGVGAGSGLTPPLLTWIILTWGWRSAFWFDAALGVFGASVWWLISRDRPEDQPRVSLAERHEIHAGLSAYAVGSDAVGSDNDALGVAQPASPPIAWRAIFSRADLPALMISYFAFVYTAWIFLVGSIFIWLRLAD
jgi:ACS family glucarate transporter-like MFS transporter